MATSQAWTPRQRAEVVTAMAVCSAFWAWVASSWWVFLGIVLPFAAFVAFPGRAVPRVRQRLFVWILAFVASGCFAASQIGSHRFAH